MSNATDSAPVEKTVKKMKKQRRRSPYAFLPLSWSRGAFLKWLRRTHAWLGLWGATLGILFGVTGILLNHRGTLKINAAKTDRIERELSLPNPKPENIEAFAAWLQVELGLDEEWSRVRTQDPREISWGGESVTQPERWSLSLSNPKRGTAQNIGSATLTPLSDNLTGICLPFSIGCTWQAEWESHGYSSPTRLQAV